ncbi:MAG TPA: hypothetical protein EYG15_07895 [Deltaproteobacteria bacterium]|nr:hypothetical protein [Deltaproteobacteria bacterium]
MGLVLLLIGGCGEQKLDSKGLESKSIGDAGTTTTTTTTTTLAVSSTTPDNGSTSVSRTANIVVNFNKSIYFIDSSNDYLLSWSDNATSTSSAACTSSGGVSSHPILISKDSYSNCLYDNGTMGSSSITIDLNSALDANTTYKVKVLKESLDGSRKLKDTDDGSGTQLSSDYEFSFTTGS